MEHFTIKSKRLFPRIFIANSDVDRKIDNNPL